MLLRPVAGRRLAVLDGRLAGAGPDLARGGQQSGGVTVLPSGAVAPVTRTGPDDMFWALACVWVGVAGVIMRDVEWLTGWSVDADCCRAPMVAKANWVPQARNPRSQASACQRNAALSTLPAGCRTPARTRGPRGR